jgi:hypothetical protein
MNKLDINDLMRGNLVMVNNYDSKYYKKIGKIKSISSYGEYISLDININSSFYTQDISPIPLTEEILLKCEGSLFIGYIHFKSYNINGIEVNFIDDKWIEYVSRVEIKYLHELQNIYYWRTKKHLQIKL